MTDLFWDIKALLQELAILRPECEVGINRIPGRLPRNPNAAKAWSLKDRTSATKGFDQDEIKAIISKVIESGKVACVEVVEVNPCLDNKGNVMAETAFDVLSDFTKKIEEVIIK